MGGGGGEVRFTDTTRACLGYGWTLLGFRGRVEVIVHVPMNTELSLFMVHMISVHCPWSVFMVIMAVFIIT